MGDLSPLCVTTQRVPDGQIERVFGTTCLALDLLTNDNKKSDESTNYQSMALAYRIIYQLSYSCFGLAPDVLVPDGQWRLYNAGNQLHRVRCEKVNSWVNRLQNVTALQCLPSHVVALVAEYRPEQSREENVLAHIAMKRTENKVSIRVDSADLLCSLIPGLIINHFTECRATLVAFNIQTGLSVHAEAKNLQVTLIQMQEMSWNLNRDENKDEDEDHSALDWSPDPNEGECPLFLIQSVDYIVHETGERIPLYSCPYELPSCFQYQNENGRSYIMGRSASWVLISEGQQVFLPSVIGLSSGRLKLCRIPFGDLQYIDPQQNEMCVKSEYTKDGYETRHTNYQIKSRPSRGRGGRGYQRRFRSSDVKEPAEKVQLWSPPPLHDPPLMFGWVSPSTTRLTQAERHTALARQQPHFKCENGSLLPIGPLRICAHSVPNNAPLPVRVQTKFVLESVKEILRTTHHASSSGLFPVLQQTIGTYRVSRFYEHLVDFPQNLVKNHEKTMNVYYQHEREKWTLIRSPSCSEPFVRCHFEPNNPCEMLQALSVGEWVGRDCLIIVSAYIGDALWTDDEWSLSLQINAVESLDGLALGAIIEVKEPIEALVRNTALSLFDRFGLGLYLLDVQTGAMTSLDVRKLLVVRVKPGPLQWARHSLKSDPTYPVIECSEGVTELGLPIKGGRNDVVMPIAYVELSVRVPGSTVEWDLNVTGPIGSHECIQLFPLHEHKIANNDHPIVVIRAHPPKRYDLPHQLFGPIFAIGRKVGWTFGHAKGGVGNIGPDSDPDVCRVLGVENHSSQN